MKTQLTVDLAVLAVSLLVHHPRQLLPSRLPFGITDLLLKSLKANDCVKVIVAKPCGPTFQAMIKAQRRNGALPDKLMEVTIHTKVVRPAQDPSPSVAVTSSKSHKDSSQTKSRSNKYIHNHSYKASAVQASTPQSPSTPTTSTQALSTPAPLTQATLLQAFPTQAATTQASTRQIDPQTIIPRNKGGQRVDPRMEAFRWLVKEVRTGSWSAGVEKVTRI